jgi:hypothetical protein
LIPGEWLAISGAKLRRRVMLFFIADAALTR